MNVAEKKELLTHLYGTSEFIQATIEANLDKMITGETTKDFERTLLNLAETAIKIVGWKY